MDCHWKQRDFGAEDPAKAAVPNIDKTTTTAIPNNSFFITTSLIELELEAYYGMYIEYTEWGQGNSLFR
jgi:hypothetical protein